MVRPWEVAFTDDDHGLVFRNAFSSRKPNVWPASCPFNTFGTGIHRQHLIEAEKKNEFDELLVFSSRLLPEMPGSQEARLQACLTRALTMRG